MRRSFPRMLVLAAAALCLRAAAPAQEPLASAVASVGMTVSDLDRSLDFYTRVLFFQKLSEDEVAGPGFERLEGVFGARARVAVLKLGDERIELTEFLAPKGRPLPPDARSNDRSFQHVAIIVSDMEKAYRWLRQNKVAHASSGPQRLPDWNPNAGGIEAFYFKDPDGHALEILRFPEGKGDPRWRAKALDGSLFLGIDHTAIVIADTDGSLRFYRDTLGFRVAGESENHGTEQEHLNNVFGARLRITAVRAAAGPGIEFLEYLSPRDGRPYPEDTRANDVLHWQTRLTVTEAEAAARRLFGVRARFLSPGAIALAPALLGTRKAFLVRDPDGHALFFAEQER